MKLKCWVAVLLLNCLATVWAQGSLIINGRSVAGMRRNLLPGSVYAPAEAIAEAIGATYLYNATTGFATFDYAANLLTVRVFADAAQAAAAGAVQLNGLPIVGSGGLIADGTVYLPVRAVTEALGGTIDLSSQTIIAVFPRAELLNAYVASGDAVGSYERVVLEFEGFTTFERYVNDTLNTLQLRFESASAAAPFELVGGYLERGFIDPSAGYLDVTIRPRSGYQFETYTAPRPGGVSVVIDIAPVGSLPGTGLRAGQASSVTQGSGLIVLDPGHGGADAGLQFSGFGTESQLTLAFAERLATRLEESGYQVQLTRSDDTALPLDQRAALGVEADLFVSLHAAALGPSQFNIYYLGDAAQQASLDLAVRENAAAALSRPNLDSLRRRLLLQLVPDAAGGEAVATSIGDALLSAAGYRANLQDAAPLVVLEGAAGRGILLELSPDDLVVNTQFVATLAEAIVTALNAQQPN